jgi:hypothetical protein
MLGSTDGLCRQFPGLSGVGGRKSFTKLLGVTGIELLNVRLVTVDDLFELGVAAVAHGVLLALLCFQLTLGN